jgi:tetratricopeptide (TPR) repeat protein
MSMTFRGGKAVRLIFLLISIAMLTQCMSSFAQEQTANYWIDKGKELSSNGSYNLSIICYNKAIDINQQSAAAWYYKGWALGRLGEYDQAFEAYNESTNIDPLMDEAWTYRGLTLLAKGYLRDEAIKSFDTAVELNKSNALAWFGKGIAVSQYGYEHGQAVTCFDKVIELNSSDELTALAYSFKAVDLLDTAGDTSYSGGTNAALESFRLINLAFQCIDNSIELAPSDTYVLGYDGLYRLNSSNITYLDGYAIEPSQLLALNYVLKGLLLNGSGSYKDAIIYYDRAIELTQPFENAVKSQGNVLNALIRNSGSSQGEDEFMNEMTSNVWSEKGSALQAQGNYEDALKHYNKAIEIDPDNYQANRYRESVLQKIGRDE